MSELLLTLLRLGFLALIWLLVVVTIIVLRRDLRAPRDARPLVATSAPRGAAKPRQGAQAGEGAAR